MKIDKNKLKEKAGEHEWNLCVSMSYRLVGMYSAVNITTTKPPPSLRFCVVNTGEYHGYGQRDQYKKESSRACVMGKNLIANDFMYGVWKTVNVDVTVKFKDIKVIFIPYTKIF